MPSSIASIIANQWSASLRTNWKVTRNLTVNLGMRYDFYGTPYEIIHGLGGKVVNAFGSPARICVGVWNRYTSPGSIRPSSL